MEEEKSKKIKLRWRDKIFLGILLFFLIWMGVDDFFGTKKKEPIVSRKETVRLRVGQSDLLVELAATEEEKYRGLSGRANLGENSGMLFLHEKPAKYPYSMREMNFPLDFVFIQGGKVIGYQENVPVDFTGEIIGKEEYDSVLEVPAGWIKKNEINLDDQVRAKK